MQSVKHVLAANSPPAQSTHQLMSSTGEKRNQVHPPIPLNRIHEPSDYDIAENEARRWRKGYAPNPLCSVCHGAGFVYRLRADGRTDYSKYEPCKAEGCLADAKQFWRESGQYLELKGVSSRLQTFKQFQRRLGTGVMLSAFKSLATGGGKPFLLCVGGPGTGKTHLCQALTTALNHRGVDAYYYRVPDLLKILRASVEEHRTDEWLKSLANVGALILDDYGLDNQTDWAAANIEDIIDARWQEKRITVMTTNKGLEQLPPRITSRFGDTELSVAVVNSAKDYRTGGK